VQQVYQCDVLYRGQKDALAEFLPLNSVNWITCGNALRLDWLTVCPPTGTGVKVVADDLFSTPLEQTEIDFENEGGETYICGNPPYKGRNKKSENQNQDLCELLSNVTKKYKSLDYVAGWFVKLARYIELVPDSSGAMVATNSVCQGEQVSILWPLIGDLYCEINFAHSSFKWSNLAIDKAGVTVVIVGLSRKSHKAKKLFQDQEMRVVRDIGPYLTPGVSTAIKATNTPLSEKPLMYLGNMAKDGGNLIMSKDAAVELTNIYEVNKKFIRDFYGAKELINASPRACIWIEDENINEANNNLKLSQIFENVKIFRGDSTAKSTQACANIPYRFIQKSAKQGEKLIVIPRVSSENRAYLPVDYLHSGAIIGDKCYAIYDEPLWNMALIASRLHWVWIGTVCVRMRTDFSYSNTLGWNTFPVPKLTEKNKTDLTRCAENILLAREAHFPATIADLYAPDKMPDNLRQAHEKNDEVLERIYIGRRFKNDTERLEKLFDLYTKMTAENNNKNKKKAQ